MSCPDTKRNEMRFRSFVRAGIWAIGVVITLTLIQAEPPRAAPRSITFFGRVETVDAERKAVKVRHGKIPGYMDSAITEYSIPDEAVLKRLEPGDDIRATVHPNDLTLYHVQIVYRRTETKGQTSK